MGDAGACLHRGGRAGPLLTASACMHIASRAPPRCRSALQGLLRKLGGGFEDMIPGMSGSRIKVGWARDGTARPSPACARRSQAPPLAAQGIISNLKQAEDESSQLTALTDLCELLSVSTEDAMAVFPVEQVVPLLVRRARSWRHR